MTKQRHPRSLRNQSSLQIRRVTRTIILLLSAGVIGGLTAEPHALATTYARAKTIKSVDLGTILDPLLQLPDFEKIYYGALRNLDFTAQCSANCPVCYVDAGPLRAAFDATSVLDRLKTDSFRNLLAKNMRTGLRSDPMDHERIEELTMGLLTAVEGTLSYDTSVPPGSVDRTKRLLQRWKVDVDMSDVDENAGWEVRIKEYVRRADKQRPLESFSAELRKLVMWLAYKPSNKPRVEGLLGGSIDKWGLSIPEGRHAIIGYHPRFIGANDYHMNRVIDLGRIRESQGLKVASPETDPLMFDCANFPHTAQTIGKGKFVITPDGAFMVISKRKTESHTGKEFIRIKKSNYRDLGMRHLITDPNPVYINDYKENPHYRRSKPLPAPRKAVLGFQ